MLYSDGGEALVQVAQRLPVAAPSLAGLKARLERAGSTLGWGKGSLPMAGGVEQDGLSGAFQPKPFCDSMNTCNHSQGKAMK